MRFQRGRLRRASVVWVFIAGTVLCQCGSTLRAQTADQYLALIRELADNPTVYPLSVLKVEAERFLRTYPLHDSGSAVVLTMALATLGMEDAETVPALMEMARAAQLFGGPRDTVLWNFAVERLLSRVTQATIFGGLERVQVETIRELALRRLYDGPKYRRAFGFLSRLYQVRSKKLATLLTDQCGWFLETFPGSPCVDTVRYWMATILAERGQHALAASQFLALAKLHPSSKWAPDAVLAAADEFCKRPVWKFAEAAEALEEYLDVFQEDFRCSALERLVVLMEQKLHKERRAEEYLLQLASGFSDRFELPEKVFREVLVRLMENPADRATRSAARRYLELHPEGKLAGILSGGPRVSEDAR